MAFGKKKKTSVLETISSGAASHLSVTTDMYEKARFAATERAEDLVRMISYETSRPDLRKKEEGKRPVGERSNDYPVKF